MERSLRGFTGTGYDKGRPLLVQAAWFAALIRQRVRVHWPWRLAVGDDVWIGEGAWLLNLEQIVIGSNVCVSQGALLCTGSHQRHSPTLEFDNGPIRLESGAWVAARAVVLRGVTVGRGAVVGASAVAHRDIGRPGAVLTTRAAA